LLMTQVGGRRMIAAMNQVVAVGARTVEQPVAARRGIFERRDAQTVVERTGVARVGVALLAQVRDLGLLQLEVVRAVRGVAVQAVLPHRRMLPQERAALLGMAGVALLVD